MTSPLVVTGRGNKLRRTQQALDLISGKCQDLGLKISAEKSRAMMVKAADPTWQLRVQGVELAWTNSYQYLGVWVDKRLSFTAHAAYLRERTQSRLNLPASKALCAVEEMRQHAFMAMAQVTEPDSVVYYTDGSADPDSGRTGAAAITRGAETELVAILLALEHAQHRRERTVVLHTDSRTGLQALQQPYPSDNVGLVTAILGSLQSLAAQGRRPLQLLFEGAANQRSFPLQSFLYRFRRECLLPIIAWPGRLPYQLHNLAVPHRNSSWYPLLLFTETVD
ncbi:hypothetical protein O3P69_018070 [Scylla paramamosain]|uniref:RNase H type-1 domain-containing protein n=1 Tax=Scylla paramamosain TaxID=85552 RepID=A0AAW0TKD3_SCYPA